LALKEERMASPVCATLITMLVSQNIKQKLRLLVANREGKECALEETVFPRLRLGVVLLAVRATLLTNVSQKLGSKDPLLVTKLIPKEAKDPNRKRDTQPQNLQKISNSST
jgi:hypothetical protein